MKWQASSIHQSNGGRSSRDTTSGAYHREGTVTWQEGRCDRGGADTQTIQNERNREGSSGTVQGRDKIPEILQRQVPMIQKVLANLEFDLKMNKAEAQLDRHWQEQTQSTEESYSPVQSEAPREERECTQKKDSRKAVVSGSRDNGARVKHE